MPAKSGQGQLDFYVHDLAEKSLEEAFIYSDNIFHIYKSHLKIYLRKFRLSVCTQVFVTEAAGNLHVAVISGQHQQLLIELRRLRQSEKLPREDPTWNQIIARALRCASNQHRSFNLQETALIIIVACQLGDPVSKHHFALHVGSAQVKIT